MSMVFHGWMKLDIPTENTSPKEKRQLRKLIERENRRQEKSQRFLEKMLPELEASAKLKQDRQETKQELPPPRDPTRRTIHTRGGIEKPHPRSMRRYRTHQEIQQELADIAEQEREDAAVLVELDSEMAFNYKEWLKREYREEDWRPEPEKDDDYDIYYRCFAGDV